MIDHSVLLRSVLLTLQYLCVLLALAVLPQPVQATIYKCVDAAGNTNYTGSPCAIDESAWKISKSATAESGQDCRVARKFSLAVSKRLKAGETSVALINSYGGLNNLNSATVGLISYIYTFKGNDSASRIASLATDRCEMGTFGPAASNCHSYPPEFIQSMGGCNAAHDGIRTNQPVLSAAKPAISRQYPLTENRDDQPSGSPSAATSARQECRERISENIASTAKSMSQALPPRTMELLRTRQRILRNQLNRC